MTTRIQPSEGRIVWVYSNKWSGKRPGTIVAVLAMLSPAGAPQTYRAQVLVNVDVNLQDFRPPGGGPVAQMECELHDPDAVPAEAADGANWCYATWMPYQQGQAGKTDALADKVAGSVDRLNNDIDRMNDRVAAVEVVISGGSGQLEGPASHTGRIEKLERTIEELLRDMRNTGARAGSVPPPGTGTLVPPEGEPVLGN